MCRAFDKYDVDGDGFISIQDLERSLLRNNGNSVTTEGHRTSNRYSRAELEAWIRGKDSTGSGVVSFTDFQRHFQNQS